MYLITVIQMIMKLNIQKLALSVGLCFVSELSLATVSEEPVYGKIFPPMMFARISGAFFAVITDSSAAGKSTAVSSSSA